MSAIKSILVNDGYPWDDNKILLGIITKACRLVNDRVVTRLPIQIGLLEVLIFEIQRIFFDQPYLEILYKAIFLLSYYGLFRIGELTLSNSNHAVKKTCDVHIGRNKNKMLFILYSSKTHGRESLPQIIKINENQCKYNCKQIKQFFCPFTASREYLAIRGNYKTDQDQFFIFSNSNPVYANQVRSVLRKTLKNVNLNPKLYNCHSFRGGRASNLLKITKFSIDEVKFAGRWKSNAVYKYIKKM